MQSLNLSCRRLAMLAVAWCCLSPLAAEAAEKGSWFTAALESISTEDLQEHVEYLAADELEGREAGSQGGLAAADYLAGKLEELGLAGAGVDGGYVQPFEPNFRNVLTLIEGSDPDAKSQYIVVGAHYDHVGYGTNRNSRGSVGHVHNGADDNASGTAGLLELAQALATLPEPPKRSILLVFWDAEEKGMLGARHWLSHPTVPLDQVAVFLNVDMIGRLRDDQLKIFGTRTGYGWRRLISQLNESPDLLIEWPWSIIPNGDYWPFLKRGIPALMLHTGTHDEYHRPSDDVELINFPGMRRVSRLLFRLTYELADRDNLPKFRDDGNRESNSTLNQILSRRPARRERLGVAWQDDQPPGPGVYLTRVTLGSPASKAGLKPGDRIVQFGGRVIHSGDDLSTAVMAAENPVSIMVERPQTEQGFELTVQLEGQPARLGITWRTDAAQPGAIILTHVVPRSPAARAGLQIGDHVYQIDGRDFSDESQFAELARSLTESIKLLIERDGRTRSVEIQLETQLDRAA